MYTRSYSIYPDIHLHVNSAELLNQAGRNNYPYNPKFVGSTGNRTFELCLDNCILATPEPFHRTYLESLLSYGHFYDLLLFDIQIFAEKESRI